jgi:hydrogenase nickel incorporation protein HypA/HybF
MHEFSMTSQIVDSVLAEARRRNAKRVLSVRLVIGKLSFLNLDQVRFSYKVLVEGTLLAGSRLYIKEQDATVECPFCGYKGGIKYIEDPSCHFKFPSLSCPKCGKDVNVVGGQECTIKSLKLVV